MIRHNAWIVVLGVVLLSVAAVVASSHEAHDSDQDCAVCQLRHQSAADLALVPDVRPTYVLAVVACVSLVGPALADYGLQIPARAPPA